MIQQHPRTHVAIGSVTAAWESWTGLTWTFLIIVSVPIISVPGMSVIATVIILIVAAMITVYYFPSLLSFSIGFQCFLSIPLVFFHQHCLLQQKWGIHSDGIERGQTFVSGWMPRHPQSEFTGSSDEECCQRTCQHFQCPTGYKAQLQHGWNPAGCPPVVFLFQNG